MMMMISIQRRDRTWEVSDEDSDSSDSSVGIRNNDVCFHPLLSLAISACFDGLMNMMMTACEALFSILDTQVSQIAGQSNP